MFLPLVISDLFMKEIMPTEILDCLGFYCPEPLFQTRERLNNLNKGDILEVLADDPAAEEDLARFCKRTGNKILGIQKTSKELQMWIQKGE